MPLGLIDWVVVKMTNLSAKLGLSNLTFRLYQLHYASAKRFLKNILSDTLAKYKSVPTSVGTEPTKDIYMLWFQGFDNVPPVVDLCASQANRLQGYRLRKLSLADVQALPLDENLKRKFEERKFSFAHYSDIVRAFLLSHYGGVWMDATLLASGLPDDLTSHSFYTCHHKSDGSFVSNPSIVKAASGFESLWTGFFMHSRRGDVVTSFLYDAFCEYWAKMDYLVDYFLIDMVIRLGYEEISEIRKEIDLVPVNNEGELYSLRGLMESDAEWSEQKWYSLNNSILNIHKLDKGINFSAGGNVFAEGLTQHFNAQYRTSEIE